MANLTISNSWDANVYRIDQLDPVLGWDGSNINIANLQAQALANRTAWLKSRVDLGMRLTGAPTYNANTSLPANVFNGQMLRGITNAGALIFTLPQAASVTDNGNAIITNEFGANYNFLSNVNNDIQLIPNATDTIVDIITGQSFGSGAAYPYMFLPGTIVHVHKLTATSWAVYRLHEASQTPPGIVVSWAVNTPPVGWFECAGQTLLRAQYPNLFAVIGTTFGTTGGTNFKLPDLRAEFIRGWDNGRGIDGSRVFGSNQQGSIMAIDSTGVNQIYAAVMTSVSVAANAALVAQRTGLDYDSNGATNYPNTTSAYANGDGSGGFDYGITRPRNVALMMCIKY
jgi:microcystin-dependent protein